MIDDGHMPLFYASVYNFCTGKGGCFGRDMGTSVILPACLRFSSEGLSGFELAVISPGVQLRKISAWMGLGLGVSVIPPVCFPSSEGRVRAGEVSPQWLTGQRADQDGLGGEGLIAFGCLWAVMCASA